MEGIGLNWVDLVIVLIVGIALADGFIRGFLLQFIELVAFVAAIVIGLSWYRPLADWLIDVLSISALIAKPVAFLGLWLAIDLSLSFGLRFVYRRLPKIVVSSLPNRLAGVVPAALKSVAYLGLALTVLLSLPFSSFVRRPIENSRLAAGIVSQTNSLVHALERSLGGSIGQTFNFLTTGETGNEQPTSITPVAADRLQSEPALEEQMLNLINEERQKVGLNNLVADEELREVARNHSRDMWIRGYFDHINLDGQDPFDRIRAAKIDFVNAGENLALAPSIDIAHFGLMRSPTHRDNILSDAFGRVGIGVISAGVDGLMVTQNFANAKED